MHNLICLVKGCEVCDCNLDVGSAICPKNKLANKYEVGALFTHCAHGCGRYLYDDGRWKFTQEAEQ